MNDQKALRYIITNKISGEDDGIEYNELKDQRMILAL
jgi:hypothetical protein